MPPSAADPAEPVEPVDPVDAAPVRVTLVGRAGCHLCVVAREVVERVCADLGVGWEEVDVDTDPALVQRWSEEVPVTLVDGRQHDFWRVDEQRLRTALAAPAPGAQPADGSAGA